jgi:hypothetical protein
LRARQHLVGDGLPVIGIARGDIGASNAQQQLSLAYRVAQARVNRDDAAEASVITGTLRETSGVTTPVTTSSNLASCATAVASGNCSG